MKRNKLLLIISIIFILLSFSGCVGITGEFGELRNKIIERFGDNYESEFQISFGSVEVTISSWFIDFAANEDKVDEMIREIDNVQFGVYQKIKNSGTSPTYKSLISIENEMKSNGWKPIVRSVDNGELNAVFVRSNPKEILNRIYVISYSDEELVLIEVEGDLKKVISYAIEKKEFDIKI